MVVPTVAQKALDAEKKPERLCLGYALFENDDREAFEALRQLGEKKLKRIVFDTLWLRTEL